MDDMNDAPALTDYIPLVTLQNNNNNNNTHLQSDPSKIADSSHASQDDPRRQSASKNISLFPILDACLRFLPVYYTHGRNKCISVFMIAVCIITYIGMPCFNIYKSTMVLRSASATSSDLQLQQSTQQYFVFIMYLFPTVVQFLRLYFFAKHFNPDIWHIWRYQSIPLLNNAMSAVSTHHRREQLSYLLQQPSNVKATISRRFKIGFLLNVVVYVVAFSVGTLTAIAFYEAELNSEQRRINTVQQIIYYAIMLLFGALPNLMMLSVARLIFTECHLHISTFTASFNVITKFSSKTSSLLDDVLTFDLHHKYLVMYTKISTYRKRVNIFVLFWVVQMAFYFWFLLTICFFVDWSKYVPQKTLSRYMAQFYIHFAVYSVQLTCSMVFMLWPAFRMTELFGTLKERMKQHIQSLFQDRTYLHDEKVLNAITKNQNHGYVNTTELYKNLALYSKQKACLEVLLQLTSIMDEKPCSYSLLGLALDRYSIRNFIAAIVVGKVTSFLWNGLY